MRAFNSYEKPLARPNLRRLYNFFACTVLTQIYALFIY